MRDETGGVLVARQKATIASARSLFATYGKKELLAKSPSPITIARNGREPGGASVPR